MLDHRREYRLSNPVVPLRIGEETGIMSLLNRREIWCEDPLRLLLRVLTRLYSLWVTATYPFASVGHDVDIHYTWDFRKYLAHRVKLGSSIVIDKDVQFGVSCSRREDPGEPVIIVDDACIIARRSQLSAKNHVHLERNVILSASVLIMDHGHKYEDPELPIRQQGITTGGRITIGEGCWIGHHAAIICDKGELRLGRNCVVAANSVVTKSFPAYSVIAGNPARVVRHFDQAKGLWVLGSSHSADSDSTSHEPRARLVRS